jgi:hypothetical protein
MAGKIQICNMALARLGANLIHSLSEAGKEARLSNLLFDDLRDELLRLYPWSFAAARIALSMPSGDVPSPWTYQYQLPADCLRARYLETAMGVKNTEFRIEGRRLLTHAANARLVYTRRITDPEQFDALFTRALAARLAAELAQPILDSASASESAWKLYERELLRAQGLDASENKDRIATEDPWVKMRR